MTFDMIALFAALAVLLATNAFFVLAEFAIVKVRPSKVTQLASQGDRRAALLARIQSHLDEYLSVCQVGITLASVALGMVGERIAAILTGGNESGARYIVAITVSYLLISGSHILLGELVPKSIAIRVADVAALLCAKPLRLFHILFFPALWVLTAASNGLLRLAGIRRSGDSEQPGEQELRIILDQSQERGLMSFRRLLFMENIFDLGGLTVRDAMRTRDQVRALDTRSPWPDNAKLIRSARFTRYPLLSAGVDTPSTFVHIKDLILAGEGAPPDLAALARPLLTTSESAPLEALLTDMQRRRVHAAVVVNAARRWTGFITLEDILEELVGTIRDEFDEEAPVRLSDVLSPNLIQFDVEATTPIAAVQGAIARMSPRGVPDAIKAILHGRAHRPGLVATYLGDGIGMPHARIAGLTDPFVMLLRSNLGVPFEGTNEKAKLLFVLLTPAGRPRIHQGLQGIIATLLHESDFVTERLLTATSPDEVIEVVRTGEQAVLD